MMRKLSETDLSIVVCGPYESPSGNFAGTGFTLRRLRELLPFAQIILSTWRSPDLRVEEVNALVDKLVIPPDPGGLQLVKLSGSVEVSNFRRMALSACEGIRAADREYVMRVRADACVNSLGALRYYEKHCVLARASKWSLFGTRILVPTLYTRDPSKGGRIFHPSDLFHLGRREDVSKLFEAAMQGSYYRNRLMPSEGSTLKAEQMLWLSCLKAAGWSVALSHEHTFNPRSIYTSEALMESNFIVATFDTLGIAFKKKFETLSGPGSCYLQRENQSQERSMVWVIVRCWAHLFLDTFRYRIGPLLFDWRPPARQWKKGLLKGVVSQVIQARRKL